MATDVINGTQAIAGTGSTARVGFPSGAKVGVKSDDTFATSGPVANFNVLSLGATLYSGQAASYSVVANATLAQDIAKQLGMLTRELIRKGILDGSYSI